MLTLAVIITMAYSALAAEYPNFVNRTEWGAQMPVAELPLKIAPPPYIVIHHSDSRGCTETDKCKSVVRSIQNYHMNTRDWDDIGYNFLVGGDGFVYEGRSFNVTGAHCPKYNSRSLGICLLGNFQDVLPSEKQLQATKSFINYLKNERYVTEDYHLIGHRQGRATQCPGDALFNEITTWPHFDQNPK